MDISKKVKYFIEKYKTNDPFLIAEELGVIVIKKQLGNIKGCYLSLKGIKFIFINSSLDEKEQLVVCAHELGHAIFHPWVHCFFTESFTLNSTEENEIEANEFCTQLTSLII